MRAGGGAAGTSGSSSRIDAIMQQAVQQMQLQDQQQQQHQLFLQQQLQFQQFQQMQQMQLQQQQLQRGQFPPSASAAVAAANLPAQLAALQLRTPAAAGIGMLPGMIGGGPTSPSDIGGGGSLVGGIGGGGGVEINFSQLPVKPLAGSASHHHAHARTSAVLPPDVLRQMTEAYEASAASALLLSMGGGGMGGVGIGVGEATPKPPSLPVTPPLHNSTSYRWSLITPRARRSAALVGQLQKQAAPTARRQLSLQGKSGSAGSSLG
ncbi:hypothetical protein HK405_011747, partial [Cladochytrium tenue]